MTFIPEYELINTPNLHILTQVSICPQKALFLSSLFSPPSLPCFLPSAVSYSLEIGNPCVCL